jgi:hypothetical protein
MLQQYKNIDEILSSVNGQTATRLPSSIPVTTTLEYNTDLSQHGADIRWELHVYRNQTWATGDHDITPWPSAIVRYNPVTGLPVNFAVPPVAFDISPYIKSFNITQGEFRIVVNGFKNLIGSYESPKLQIEEISPDRTEIKLRSIDVDDVEFRTQMSSYAANICQTKPNENYRTFLLNFSRNKTIHYVNSVVVGEFLYVKLLDPIPNEFKTGNKCWVVEELRLPHVDSINVVRTEDTSNLNTLASPNWEASYEYHTSAGTDLETWNSLTGIQTSQQIIDEYFSGSLDKVKLNIDFSDFNNFIFYSSATERVKNFNYKLQLLEFYTVQTSILQNVSGSVAQNNIQDFTNLKTNIISSFDDFEKYLYYESSSILFNNDRPLENANVPDITGSYVQPSPKSTLTKPHVLYSVTSSIYKSWYEDLLDNATQYDTKNLNSLINALPYYVRVLENTDDAVAFVNMLGQHFDILYTYIAHMSKIHQREEHPKLAMPNKLLYHVAQQFGWSLTDGKQSKQLWEYIFGVNSNGAPLTGSNSQIESMSAQDMTFTVWRRIVNNLPLLLKTKGTKRSIHTLLACYGIPNSIITIKEFGGPRIDRAPVYEKLNFDYALDLINNSSGIVETSYSGSVKSIELRFRLDDVTVNPSIPSVMSLYSVNSNEIDVEFISGTYGRLRINGNPTNNIEVFDGGWVNTLLTWDGASTLNLYAARSKYGKIVNTVSASSAGTIPTVETIEFGTNGSSNRMVGQLQEFRLWSEPVSLQDFHNHTKAPGAYNSNINSFEELLYHQPFNKKIDHSVTGSLFGIQPMSSSISSSFTGWSLNTPYDSIEEIYYYDSVSIGAGTYDDNKVRIESNELISSLSVNRRAELSQYDTSPLDSRKLGVYFSPQTMVDEDIIAQLGFIDLDDYIGDPGDKNKNVYPRLQQFANKYYWNKYSLKPDINEYIRIFTLFDMSFFKQLEQLIPARVNAFTGLVIKPTLLERNRQSVLPELYTTDLSYDVTITQTQPSVSADYNLYTASFGKIVEVNSNVVEVLTMTLSNPKNTATIYSYPYVFWNGTTYVTGSSPYWYSDSLMPNISSSNPSTFKTSQADPSSSIVPAEVQDFLPTGLFNLKYGGSKMSSPDFNINSTDTIDGQPVVEFTIVNPNQIIP